MSYELLDDINSPRDLDKLSDNQIPELCKQIRDFLVENVERTGGHLASNLGVVELTVALHRVFDSPRDHIIFDVGHQCYVHKLITGRKAGFSELRKTGGLSGFTMRRESEHDPFGAGHSSTALSAALGFAEADKLSGSNAYSIAVVGDGAYTGGMVHEALNNCTDNIRLIMVLNENGMSISVNKGKFASYLSRVRMSRKYRRWKSGTNSFLSHIPLIGKPMRTALSFFKRTIKNLFYSPNYFEKLGMYYIGPIDGNDYARVESALREAKQLCMPVVVHVKTQKGKGYAPAEEAPDDFHSVYGGKRSEDTFHSVFGRELAKLARDDDKIVAVTAAMGIGTGLDIFEKQHPERCFDVGIAEPHALTFSAGLAASGYKPFVAIYSTFLQRGYDNILHDIALQELGVKLMIDRAGLAVSDGATHHGIFDVSFLSHIPNMTILAPATYSSLRAAIAEAAGTDTPIAIRYPNAPEAAELDAVFGIPSVLGVRADFLPNEKKRYVFITYGKLVERVLSAAQMLREEGYDVGVILAERIKPYGTLADNIAPYINSAEKILFCEEGINNGGAGMILHSVLRERGMLGACEYDVAAIDDNFASPHHRCDLYDYVGLSAERLREKMLGNKITE